MEPYIKSQPPTKYVSEWYHRHYASKDNTGAADYDYTDRFGGATFGIANSLNGYRLPNYRSLIRFGENATTPLTATQAHIEPSFVTAGVQYSDLIFQGHATKGEEIYGFVDHSDPWNFPSAPPSDVVAEVTNRCIRKFLDRAESIRSSVEAGQDFGEYRETLNGITRPLGSLKDYVLSYFPRVEKLKGRYKKDRLSLTKALADTYLEWTFGWHPLALDIANAYVGLRNRSRFSDRQMVTASASGRYGDTVQVRLPVSEGGLLANLYQDSVKYSEYKVKMYGMIRTGAINGVVSRAQTLELDLPHFVPTIWDLLPYSFIVDYFVNVGDIIRSLSTISSLYIWSGESQSNHGYTQFSDVYFDKDVIPTPSQGTKDFSWARGGRSRFVIKSVTRFIGSQASFLPSVVFHLPTSEKPWENLAALLLSRINKLVPLI